MKQEKKLKEKVMALAEKNYASLGTFIRLVDYMVVETQVTINQDSADTIITEMDKNDGTRKYQIQTQVTFASDNDGMVFDPGHTDFITNFEKILQDMQTVTEDQ
jgi:dynein heavy chain